MFHEDLLHTLRESHYDVLLSDPMMPFPDLMAQKLNIPHVLSMRATFAYIAERLCGQMPAPPSYVPAAALRGYLTDRMSFIERVENMLLYIIHTTLFPLSMNNYYSENLSKPTTMCETIGKTDIMLIRTYWDFEYPRPLLPNFKFVGGLHCKPAKSLGCMNGKGSDLAPLTSKDTLDLWCLSHFANCTWHILT
uniref:UDP-glucuronosyltransferase 2A3-like n=1 Tax=Sinocyclocheilus anshuiensis TaxID=1608454 RepID=A0A671L9V8_9TELE